MNYRTILSRLVFYVTPLLLVLLATFWSNGGFAPRERLLEEAQASLAAGRFPEAEAHCRRLLERRPDCVSALLIAGEAAMKQRRWQDALDFYARVRDEAGDQAAVAHAAAGDILLFELGRPSEAERQFRDALRIAPNFIQARTRLAYILGLFGRHWESLPHLFELLRRDQFSPTMLLLASHRTVTVDLTDEINRLRRGAADDPLASIGLARIALLHGRTDEAKRLLRDALARDNQQIEAHAQLGQALLESGAEEELAEWNRSLPHAAERHPDVWCVRARCAARHGQERAAARSFWEALRLDPNNQAATFHLAQWFERAGDASRAERFAGQAERLQRLATTLDLLYLGSPEPQLLRQAAELSESLGRLWEAWAWHRVALTFHPELAWAKQGLPRLAACLSPGLPPTLPAHDLSREIDLSSLPLPTWPECERHHPSPASPKPASFTFDDVAEASGIGFCYYAGHEPSQPAHRMFEFTGGGVAAFDYDGDAWPDLYFTQGCRWPPRAGQSEHLDRVYRNDAQEHFRDVTESCGIAEERFSQGLASGDFNQDGFADLYVANIGQNRLYMNCGDGTFLDVTDAAGLDDEGWTTSCLIADLNGDALPDIYDVNYLKGDDAYTYVCQRADGKPAACPPTLFEAQTDRCYLNLGDGRYRDCTAEAGLIASGGNGLGVVAADFDGSGRLGLFVANDQDANFLFANRTPARGAAPAFAEYGAISGAAFGSDGKAQASMGVAAGDADGDGQLDLFVTNFYREPNALYIGDGTGLFTDAVSEAGLREQGYNMLGFGTQFIDADLDGCPDLLVANGHIDDLRYRGVPYEMPPQFFRNIGAGRFAEQPAETLGGYFAARHLGRGLARLDFNRDGREDFAVAHLDAPAALVKNDTGRAGHFLALRLRGVASERDAIGAKATAVLGERSLVHQLTAGDGYQACNQRQLVFGLGACGAIDRLTIKWPSGKRQQFANVLADHELLVVEGRDELVPLLRDLP